MVSAERSSGAAASTPQNSIPRNRSLSEPIMDSPSDRYYTSIPQRRTMRSKTFIVGVLALTGLIALVGIVIGQEREDRTLLSHDQMTSIINEVSGERALHHVRELVRYQFVRPPSEYQGQFREAEAMAIMPKDYGFSNAVIEDYPTGTTYQPPTGELWVTSPRSMKLYDIHDIPESLASTTASGAISGERVLITQDQQQDFGRKDVKGKFVLSLAPTGLGALYNRAVAAGAIGVVG